METGKQVKLTFNGFDITNLHFNSKGVYNQKEEIKLNLSPGVFYPPENDKVFVIAIKVSLVCEGVFDMNFIGLGNFNFEGEIDAKMRNTMVNANAPAIVFPYIRAFVTTLTSNMGNVIKPILLPPQFFKGDLKEIKDLLDLN